MGEPPPRLSKHRTRLGLTQEEVAEQLNSLAWQVRRVAVGVDRAAVSKWERGEKRPSRLYRDLLCLLYQTDEHDLGLRPGSRALSVCRPDCGNDLAGEDVNRRQLLQGAALGAVGLSTIQPWERLAAALVPAPMDPAIIERARKANEHLFWLEERLPARQLLARVTAQVDLLSELMEGSLTTAHRRTLSTLAGEAAALAGWIAFDMHDGKTARRYYRTAAAAAKEAGDRPLLACVLGYTSYIYSRRGDHLHARQVLDQAEKTAGHAYTTRAWLAGRLAEEAAGLGDAPAALSALDRSRAAMAETNGDKRAWTYFLDPARHGSLQIATDVRLGRVKQAARTAETVLGALDTREAKKRSIALADVASAALHQDDLDRACALATEALAVSRRTETTIGMHRVHQLRRDMQPWNGTRSVRLLDQQIAAASTETTP